jgi:hypothetical protein
MPLHMVTYLEEGQLLPYVREFQTEKNNTDLFQHKNGAKVPRRFDEFADADKEYLEWFLCNHAQVFYMEQEYFDSPHGSWNETTTFEFECKLRQSKDISFDYIVPQDVLTSFSISNINASIYAGREETKTEEQR